MRYDSICMESLTRQNDGDGERIVGCQGFQMAVAVEEHHQGNNGDGIVLGLFCTQIMKLHKATHIHMHAHTHECVHAMLMKSE